MPGLLIQLPDRWAFASVGYRNGPDIVHVIVPEAVRDMRTVTVQQGVVLLIEVDDRGSSRLFEFLLAGDDAKSAASRTALALGRDAGMVDKEGRPDPQWRRRVDDGSTELARIGAMKRDPSRPGGIGYMQGPTPGMHSGPYSVQDVGDSIRGRGSTEDALVVKWRDVRDHWIGPMTHPDVVLHRSGDAIVLRLDPAQHGGYDLVIHPDRMTPWIITLRRRKQERDR